MQRFGMSTFYVDSTLMNSRCWMRILKSREIKRVMYDAILKQNTREHDLGFKINCIFVKIE